MKKGIPQGDFKKRLEEFDGLTRVFKCGISLGCCNLLMPPQRIVNQ